MTLSLAVPGADPVTTLDNGVKIIRMADFVGAARGTLSTVSDPLSVAGTVVKDEQAIAPPSTFASTFSSVSDSITIPVAAIGFPAYYGYVNFLGLRCAGSTPANGRAAEFWNYFNNLIGPTVRLGFDGSPSSSNNRVPTSIYEHYSLLNLGGFTGVSATNLNIRAWSFTNVADPMAWYLDVLYLVPTSLAASDESNGFSYGTWAYWLPQLVLDPGAIATDDVPIDIGQFSVLESLADGVFLFGTGLDAQEAFDENTEFDWKHLFFNEPEREASWLTIVGCGSRLIKPETIETIDFSDTTGTPQWGEYLTPKSYVLTGTGTSIGSEGWAAVSGQFLLRGSASAPPAGHNFYFYWALGQRRTGLTGTFNVNDPRTYTKVMGNLESFVMTMKCTLTDGYPTGTHGVQWAVGAVRYTPSVPRYAHALVIEHTPGGASTAKLASRYSNNESPYSAMDTGGAISVLGGLSAGGSYWVKVERRWYNWRAKVWLDGDPEPSSWDLEAHESVIFSSGSPIQYPYTTGWSGSPNNENFPVTFPIDSSLFGSPWTPGGEMVFLDGCTSTHWHFAIDDITVEYDPDPAPGGSGTYTGAYYHIEKYDGSVDWGTVYVPPGAIQVLYTDYAAHHFGGNAINGWDIHGGNFAAWKEAGGKLGQAAAYSNFYFRRPARRPLWGDIKFP